MTLFSEFQTVCRILFEQGLMSSLGGNISVREGENLVITRRAKRAENICESDLVQTGINRDDENTLLASSELAVHRTIYQATGAQAVVHAHPPHAIALSLIDKEIIPPDLEGYYYLGRVPVLGWHKEIKAGALAEDIALALKEHKIVMVHGHGSFAVGGTLTEAADCTAALETSAHIVCLVRQLGGNRLPD